MFGGGGGGYYTPPVDTTQERIQEERDAAKLAEGKEKELARKRRGRRSTILTSALGLSGDPDVTFAGKKTLGE